MRCRHQANFCNPGCRWDGPFCHARHCGHGPGGLSWWHMVDLFEGLTQKGDVVGLNLVEMAPSNDLHQITMIGAGRLAMKLIMLQKIKNRHKPGR